MNEQEIKEGNKLIAEFMGYKFSTEKPWQIIKPNEEDWYFGSWLDVDLKSHIVNHLPYQSSWDWIMPVVENIELLSNVFTNLCNSTDNKNEFEIRMYNEYGDIPYQEQSNSEVKITAVYFGVIKFIKWYNTRTHE